MNREPICVTGIGALTSLGSSYAEIADNLLFGVSGVARVTRFPVDHHLAQIGACIGDVPCPAHWNKTDFEVLPHIDQATLWCCVGALNDAGWWDRRGATRIGLLLGNAAEWNLQWEHDFANGGNAIFTPQSHLEPLAQRIGRQLDISGPALSMSAACASGNYALALARRWLQMGWVDVCLAGACELAVSPITLAGFGNLRALSNRNGEPTRASRPFDVDRDGFVMGDGGAVFVLERMTQARRRSAKIYAEIAGCGASSDAYHMVIPSPHPEPAIAAMRQALADARLDPSAVDYVNAHATSTPVGDQAEAKVLQAVFGSNIEKMPVSSTKSMTGHLLTAAAAVEALACVVALERQTVPPTINLENIDPECRLRHVPNQAEAHRIKVTASNSFGFGGSNTCLIVRAA
jgi:3-oxoacyl-[acyl-carrier-protein] synthase II